MLAKATLQDTTITTMDEAERTERTCLLNLVVHITMVISKLGGTQDGMSNAELPQTAMRVVTTSTTVDLVTTIATRETITAKGI